MELLLRIVKWSALAGGLTLALLALKGPLDRRYRAKWRYWLWLALAAALVLAPVPWGSLLPERVQEMEPPVVVRVPQTTIVVGAEGLSLAPREELTEDILPLEPVTGAPVAQVQPDAAGEKATTLPLDAVLTAIWLAGAAALLVWRLVGSRAFARKIRRWSGAARPRRRSWPSVTTSGGTWGSNGWYPWRCAPPWTPPWRWGCCGPGCCCPVGTTGRRS